jgi:cystathionine beta-lyase/cystathionine gamma-synthase
MVNIGHNPHPFCAMLLLLQAKNLGNRILGWWLDALNLQHYQAQGYQVGGARHPFFLSHHSQFFAIPPLS